MPLVEAVGMQETCPRRCAASGRVRMAQIAERKKVSRYPASPTDGQRNGGIAIQCRVDRMDALSEGALRRKHPALLLEWFFRLERAPVRPRQLSAHALG